VARNGTWIALALAFAGIAGADEDLLQRWDHPKRETFEMKGVPPERVAEEIRKRFGTAFKLDATNVERTDFVAKDVTFLEALDGFAAAQGLFLVGVPAPEETRECHEALALVRVDRPLGATPVAYVGPSRLSVQGLAARTTWVFTAEGPRIGPSPMLAAWSDLENEEHLCVVFKWIVEPGLEDALLVRLKVAAQDDTGRDLRALPRYIFDPPHLICGELPLRANGYFHVNLPAPRAEARALRRLSGSMEVALPVERSEIAFDPRNVGDTKSLGGCQVKLVEGDGTITRFAFEGIPCKEIRQSDPVDQIEILGFGADGRAVEYSRCGGTVGDGRATWWNAWDQPPSRIVLRAITKVVLREVPFAFDDVPLPE